MFKEKLKEFAVVQDKDETSITFQQKSPRTNKSSFKPKLVKLKQDKISSPKSNHSYTDSV